MLDLHLATALELLHVTVLGEPGGIPEAQRLLVADGALEAVGDALPLRKSVVARALLARAQGRAGVEGPVTPGGAGQAILEEPQMSADSRAKLTTRDADGTVRRDSTSKRTEK